MNQRQIVVDIGNSMTKLAIVAEERDPVSSLSNVIRTTSRELDFATIHEFAGPSRCQWHVASARRETESVLRSWVQTGRPLDEYRCLSRYDLNLPVNVDSPDRVGVDRLLAAFAARTMVGGPVIVANSGTAITVDYVDGAGVFQGGSILPGLTISAQSLSAGTDALPDISSLLEDGFPNAIGKSTEEALRSGLLWGTVGSVAQMIERITNESGEAPGVVVSGGDGRIVSNQLPQAVQFIDNIVLIGIAMSRPPKS